MRAGIRNLSGRSPACSARARAGARRKCDEWSSVIIQPRVGPRCLPKFHSILFPARLLAGQDTARVTGSREQGESESVINHRETPGGKVEALPIGARDRLSLSCRMIDLAGTFTHAGCRFVELASPQRIEEVPREKHPLSLTPGKPLPDQLLDARLHRAADLPGRTRPNSGMRGYGQQAAD